MTQSSTSLISSSNSLLHPNLFESYLQNCTTLNLQLRHELETRFSQLPLTKSSISTILLQLASSQEIYFDPSPYILPVVNITDPTHTDILTLLHLPHDGEHLELCGNLLSQLEKFIVESIFMFLRLQSCSNEDYLVDTMNFNELKGMTSEKFDLLVYFTTINNPRLFAMFQTKATGQVTYHPNTELVVSILYQKMFYRRVVRVLYEKGDTVRKITQLKHTGITFDKQKMKTMKDPTHRTNSLLQRCHTDRAIFMKLFRDANSKTSDDLFPMPVETLYRRATKLNRTLKHFANDPTLQTLKIISKEREDHLTCESLRRSLDIAPRAKLILQQPITFKELFVCLDQIFSSEEMSEKGNMLYRDLELIQDQYWDKPIDTSVTSVDNTLFVSRLGQTMIFKGEVRRLVEEKR